MKVNTGAVFIISTHICNYFLLRKNSSFRIALNSSNHVGLQYFFAYETSVHVNIRLRWKAIRYLVPIIDNFR